MARSAAAAPRKRIRHSHSRPKKPARRASGRSGGAHKSIANRNAAAIKKSAATKKAAARKAGAAHRTGSARKSAASGPGARSMAAGGGGAIALPLPVRVAQAPFTRALRARGGGVLDALLRGRGWIVLVGVLLAGIVFFNVDLLKLNREIAVTAQKASGVARENSRLRLELAKLDSSERVQRAAAARGMLLPAPGDVHYLRVNPPVDGRRAAKLVAESAALAPPAPEPEPLPEPAAPAPVEAAQPQPAPTAPAAAAPQPQPQVQAQAQPQPQAGTGTTAVPAG